MHSIYRFISPSGKSYIGQSVNAEDRKKQHIRSYKRWLRNGRPDRSTVKLFCAFDKYPPETWSFEVLHEGVSTSDIHDLEKATIVKYDSVNNGYNIAAGGYGGGMTGRKHSPETRAKMRATRLANPELRALSKAWSQSRRGVEVSDESRQKMSLGQKRRFAK